MANGGKRGRGDAQSNCYKTVFESALHTPSVEDPDHFAGSRISLAVSRPGYDPDWRIGFESVQKGQMTVDIGMYE